MNLADEMRKAWGQRSGEAYRDLAYSQQAPGLFKPSWISRAQFAYKRAQDEMRRWS